MHTNSRESKNPDLITYCAEYIIAKKTKHTHAVQNLSPSLPGATLAYQRETPPKKPSWRVGGNRRPAVSMEISNLIIQLPWRAQTEPSKVIIYYISHQPGMCERLRGSQWVCERVARCDKESQWIHSSVYTYGDLHSSSSLKKKTDSSGWKGGAMDGKLRMGKERKRGGGRRRHGVKEQASMMSLKHQGFISQTAMQQLSHEIVKHFTLGFSNSPHLFFLSSPARFPFLSVILPRVEFQNRTSVVLSNRTKPAA